MKKALALILSLLMVLALIPSAVAEGEATVASATLMTALPETGDRVVIHNTHYNKAMDACGTSGYYNAGVDITPADGVLTGITDSIIFLNRTQQLAQIEVNEGGTTATFALNLGSEESACAEHSVILNKPFLYMIYDREYGLPVFIGTVQSL